MELSVVVPVYNEEECIEEVLRSIDREIVAKLDSSELIVVDDGSKDGTARVLESLTSSMPRLRVLTQSPNQGHGPAIRRGFQEARGEYVFHMDSDNQFKPEEFWRLWAVRDDADLVLGYREVRHDPVLRLFITRVVRLLNLLLFGRYLRDANVPFKLMRASCLRDLLAEIPADTFAPSILIAGLAANRGLRLCQLPVTHLPRLTGQCSILRWKLLRVCLLSAWQLAKLAVVARFGGRRKGG